MKGTTFVGLDVHKRMTSVAVADSGRGGEVRYLGEIPSTPVALDRLLARLTKDGRRPSFCCEAGPCGYGVHRQLSGLGQDCIVVALSLIPSRPGDRVKTNRRAATMLAKLLHRAGELTPVRVPDGAHEAMRDLVRARATARRVLIEDAWTYRMQARVSRKLLNRMEELPQPIREVAWKAQLRLCNRHRRLAAAGKPNVAVTTAIAREMVDFHLRLPNVPNRGILSMQPSPLSDGFQHHPQCGNIGDRQGDRSSTKLR